MTDPITGFSLTPVKERAALLMVDGMSGADIARTVGKTPKTISEWKKEPEFQVRLNELRASVSEQAQELLRRNLVNNITIIQNIAQHGGEPGVVASQLKAATWLADKVLKPVSGEGDLGDPHGVANAVERLSAEEQEELLARGI